MIANYFHSIFFDNSKFKLLLLVCAEVGLEEDPFHPVHEVALGSGSAARRAELGSDSVAGRALALGSVAWRLASPKGSLHRSLKG